ncbi:heme NO-binding domain-containing protein [Cochlodiniinecator piscidefendens]|uniref:heme NO-binding domain-containing protein n=1 Tax=Cochlodiniinecator piscidefendens TaxID=2715756 RepID=UPI0014099263|nr:heme NO-binding domain-containing protein [Cochlodiniinecator piscidefendens]
MHGLINRSIQCFITDTYGAELWEKITKDAGFEQSSFEAMLSYPDKDTFTLLDASALNLRKERSDVLEDLGTYLVSHKTTSAVRRLLRFSGVDFTDFLHSLDDLPDWVELAVPDLVIPSLELKNHGPGRFSLYCGWKYEGGGHVMVGVLRGMADEYGALVFLEHQGTQQGREIIGIDVAEASFAEGRDFSLSERSGT